MNKEKKSEVWGELATLLWFPLILILLVLFGIFLILYLPFDYIRYKHSPYYKDTKQKYVPLATMGEGFALYTAVRRAGLPIRYLPNPKARSVEGGWFWYNGTLVCPSSEPFAYDEEKGDFCIVEEGEGENQPLLTLTERLEEALADFRGAYPDERAERALLFFRKSSFDDPVRAEGDARILLWEGDRATALAAYFGLEKKGEWDATDL